MGTSRIAIIIPVYNGARYLAETLGSVLRQTLPASEILVIDDGSRDDSASLARSLHPSIQVISRTNSGISASRNFGASAVDSPWLVFLDQDDLLEPEALARRAAALAAASGPDRSPDVCYSDRRHLSPTIDPSHFILGEPIRLPPPSLLRLRLNDRCFFNPGSATIRRSTFLASGGFDSDLDGVEDWDLWIRLLDRGARFIYLPEPLQQYRLHPYSATQNAPLILARSLALLQKTILPRMSPAERLILGRRVASRLEAEAAIGMRTQRHPDFRKTMLRSLARDPFHEPRRYKIALQMLLVDGRASAARRSKLHLRPQ